MPTPDSQDMFGSPVDDVFEVDLTDVAAGNRGVPVGQYLGYCSDIRHDTSSNGNPMWTWEFTVSQGPYAGRTMLMWTVLTPNALWKVAQNTEALGIGTTGGPLSFRRSAALRRPCLLIVVETEYQGKKRTSLDRIERLPENATTQGIAAPGAGSLPVAAPSAGQARGLPRTASPALPS